MIVNNIKICIRFVLLLSFSFLLNSCVKVDQSMKLFFPEDLKELQFVQTEFSAFWWNFVIIQPSAVDHQPDYSTAEKICEQLRLHQNQELRFVICGAGLGGAEGLISSWTQDYILRQEFKSDQIEKYKHLLENSAIQAAYVNDPQLFRVLRFDPFQSWTEYVDLAQGSFSKSFQRRQGYLYDESTGRLIIPLQFQLSPQLESIEPIMKIVNDYSSAFLVGSHGSTYRNEKQVRDDVALVSWISSAVFILFMIFLVLKSRVSILLLVIPVSVAMYLATLLTQWLDGSVHGLTLAFGSGIVGLALDYGLHGAFGAESKQTWTSNTIGLLTTLSGVCILVLSGIPLIRQMMIFSSVGLGLGFLFFYLLFKYYSSFFKIRPLNFVLPQIRFSWVALCLIVLGGCIGLVRTKMTMDLRKLSFVTEKESELTTWFFSKSASGESFLLMKPLAEANSHETFQVASEFEWARKNGISYEGLSKYIPDFQTVQKNQKSWFDQGCLFLQKQTSSDTQKIFNPFIEKQCLQTQSTLPTPETWMSDLKTKPYLSHLIGQSHSLSIFMPVNDQQKKLVQQNYPQARSLTEAIMNFSKSLEKDLSWMIPASLFLTILILAVYYRRFSLVFTALLPFLTGLGFYFSVAELMSFDVDLISILGLVMVFGFSIDYGVFATDVHRHDSSTTEVQSVYTALSFAAVTNVLGFLPMIFAGHPVLFKLGCALFYGTVGTYLGTVYGVYPYYQRQFKSKMEVVSNA